MLKPDLEGVHMTATLMEELTHMSGTKGASILDEALGIVEAIVSGAGNKDSVGDIVMPGAFAKSLEKRQPRVVWGHDWNHPIGKVLEIYEIPGSDPRVPEKAKGLLTAALYVKVQFNLLSEKGREAFSMVAFFGNDQEWSIGYKTSKSQYDPMIKANRLHEVELFEVSPVLHGANNLTGTVSVKEHHDDETSGNVGMLDRRESMTRALVSRTKSPVSVVDINDNDGKVVYQTDASETYSATFAEKEDGEVLFGNPVKVRMEVRYVPDEDEEKGMMRAVPDEEDDMEEDMVAKDMMMGYDDEMSASERSPKIGCVGFHEQDGRYYPCEDAAALRRAMRMRMDGEKPVKDAASGGCSCGGSCCGGGAKADEPELAVEENLSLFVEVNGDVDMDAVKSAVGVLAVDVRGSKIVFGEGVDEAAMKSAVATALAGVGVSSVSIGRLSSSDELE
jgi:HK97 family phage prohead protease